MGEQWGRLGVWRHSAGPARRPAEEIGRIGQIRLMWDRLREQMKQLGIQKELEDELRTGIALQARIAEREQAKIAAANRRRPRAAIEGVGQTKLCMHPFFRALADVRFGAGWQKDKATVRRLLAENPEFAVAYAAKKVSVMVDGRKGETGKGRNTQRSTPNAQHRTGGIVLA